MFSGQTILGGDKWRVFVGGVFTFYMCELFGCSGVMRCGVFQGGGGGSSNLEKKVILFSRCGWERSLEIVVGDLFGVE